MVGGGVGNRNLSVLIQSDKEQKKCSKYNEQGNTHNYSYISNGIHQDSIVVVNELFINVIGVVENDKFMFDKMKEYVESMTFFHRS